MKWFLVCLSLVCFVSIGLADKVEPKGGNCEITFPGKPTEKPGDKSLQIIQEAQEGKAALMLQFNEMPAKIDIANKELVGKVFDGGQGGLTQALKGTIKVNKDGTFGKYPSRDIDMEVQGLGIYRVKFILTGDKFYQVTAAGPADYVNGAEVKAFMDSFKFKD